MNKFTFANISTFGSIAAIYLLAIVPPLCSLAVAAFLFHGCPYRYERVARGYTYAVDKWNTNRPYDVSGENDVGKLTQKIDFDVLQRRQIITTTHPGLAYYSNEV
jgi:hypothetical protein